MKRHLLVAAVGILAILAIASPVFGGPSLKSLVKKEVARQLAGKTGPQGPPGPQGATGPPGSPSAGAVFGRVNNLATTINTTEYGSPSGTSTPGGTAQSVWMTSPSVGIVVSDFNFNVTSFPGAGAERTFTVMLQTNPTSISCTVAENATQCNPAGQLTVPSGSLISIRAQTGTVSPAASPVSFSYRATAP